MGQTDNESDARHPSGGGGPDLSGPDLSGPDDMGVAKRPGESITVCLMRHAKSDWDHAMLSDHDRPLNERGRRDAPRMARWLAQRGYLPDLILASTAARVRQTIEGLLSVWTHRPLVLTSSSLYLASPTTIREHLLCDAILPDGHRPRVAMVVAHNPGIEELTSQWLGMPTRMPTAAVAIFQCEPLRPEDLAGPRPRRFIALGLPKEIDLDDEATGSGPDRKRPKDARGDRPGSRGGRSS